MAFNRNLSQQKITSNAPLTPPKIIFLILVLVLIFGLIGLRSMNAASVVSTQISIVSSIKPIQLIATSVIGDLGESSLLLPASANPHHYQLKPSQREMLNDANLFVWVGPELELFLVKVLKNSSITQLSLIKALQIEGSSNVHLATTHQDHHDHQHSAKQHQDFDPHIWLNPAHAEKIAVAIYHRLTTIYPQLEPQLRHNLERFLTRLKAAEKSIAKQFGTENPIDIYTFHQAFAHFADHYGLKIAGAITRSPEARPGAKHLSQLTKEIHERKRICLIKEPNFKAPYVESITRDTEVIIATADPLATHIENSETGYIEFIHSIADSFANCLK